MGDVVTTRHAAWNIQCISVATATSAAGPFRDRSNKPFICQREHNGSIDPSPGTWEDPLIEGPSMGLVGGKDHYLFHGAGWWDSDKSGIGYALCTGPLGGCLKRTTTAAWMPTDAIKAGPAGPTLFSPDSGATWWIAYHAWEPGNVGYPAGRRALWIDAVDFSAAGPIVQ